MTHFRTILFVAVTFLLLTTPVLAKHAPKHALLVKHPHTVAVTVHIPANAYQKAVRKPRRR